jgi:hypothetical protein
MTSGIYLPTSVAREALERQQSYRADVLGSIDLDDPVAAEFSFRLQNFDRRLMLVRALDRIVPGLPMKPGHYHLLVDNGPGIPLSVTVIEGADGEFCEPTSRIFEKLVAGDMREQRNLERFARVESEQRRANARELEDDRAERKEHLKDLVNAYTRTGVSLTKARPWTQNTQPNARREAGERHLKAVE